MGKARGGAPHWSCPREAKRETVEIVKKVVRLGEAPGLAVVLLRVQNAVGSKRERALEKALPRSRLCRVSHNIEIVHSCLPTTNGEDLPFGKERASYEGIVPLGSLQRDVWN